MEIEFWSFGVLEFGLSLPYQTGLATAGGAVEEISSPIGYTALGVPSLQTQKGASVVRHVRVVTSSNHIR